MADMTEQHWNFIKKLVLDTRITVVLPSYPIAPKYCYTDTLEFSEAVYKDLIKEKGSENVIAIGDSAGGGLILALEEKIIEENKLSNSENIDNKNMFAENNELESTQNDEKDRLQNNQELPQSTILISPWLDVSMSNEQIGEVQKYDNDLNKEKLVAAGILYSKGTDTKNYLVSPIYGDLSKLKNLTIFTGTYDILNPDVHLLAKKAQDSNVQIDVKEYEKASHIWIIKNNCDQQLVDDAYNDLKKLIMNE